jgi:hypothetical protein
MPENWYKVVEAGTPISQGDLIADCPVMTWVPNRLKIDSGNEVEGLRAAADVMRADVVVMTQACDLAQSHVENIILCPHVSLEEYHGLFEAKMRAERNTPTTKAWRTHCDDVKDGYIWNLAMINAEDHGDIRTAHRIVDFREVFTVPRSFIESLLAQRGRARLTLLPPYREHLSQAFARFFMRVGLPTAVANAW